MKKIIFVLLTCITLSLISSPDCLSKRNTKRALGRSGLGPVSCNCSCQRYRKVGPQKICSNCSHRQQPKNYEPKNKQKRK